MEYKIFSKTYQKVYNIYKFLNFVLLKMYNSIVNNTKRILRFKHFN